MYELNFSPEGFQWINADDAEKSVISWIRKGKQEKDSLIFIANYSPVAWENYRVGVPKLGYYQEVFNSDNMYYGGSDVKNSGDIETSPIPFNHHTHSLSLKLPPLAVVVLKYNGSFSWISGK